jgi:RNA polymerase sigma factor (sigma-70 family)
LSVGTFEWREPREPKNLREGNPVVVHLGYTDESVEEGVELSSPERTIEPNDRAAEVLADLHREHARLVAGICRGMLRDPEEAADAAQQSFLAAHRSLLAGTSPEEPAAWLATIARNECRMRIRKRIAAPLTVELDPELDGRGDTTHQAAVERAGVTELRDALAELPERQREALLLREVRGLSYDEVARAMEVSSPSVEALLWRARKTVAERVRLLPGLVVVWAKDALTRLGGPADVVSTAALAAKGGAALLAALTATPAAVEVNDRATAAGIAVPPPIVAAKDGDNSGPGSASSGRGSEGEIEPGDDSRGQNRGRGSDDSVAEDRSGRSSDDSSGKGSGEPDDSG